MTFIVVAYDYDDLASDHFRIVGELVKCKNCKYRNKEDGFCEGRGWPKQLVPDNGFCDKAEKDPDPIDLLRLSYKKAKENDQKRTGEIW